LVAPRQSAERRRAIFARLSHDARITQSVGTVMFANADARLKYGRRRYQ
jgi:hypothetical protein